MVWILGGSVVALVGAILAAPTVLAAQRKREVAQATRQFKLRREVLEAKFFDLASQLGKPRGLRWKHCDWKETVRFARDNSTNMLTAFASVEIHFEAVEGGDMEDVAAVSDVRDASALFHYQNGVWGTGGKAMFNMDPESAVTRLEGQYDAV